MEVEGCPHKRKHVHGTLAAYSNCNCRCEACRAARRRYIKQWHAGRRLKADSRRARNRVLNMRMTMSLDEISEVTGLSTGYLRKVMHQEGQMVPRTIKAIMSTPVPYSPVRISGWKWTVPAIATTRRLQGLSLLGWTLEALAEETGLSRNTLAPLRRGSSRTTTAKVDAIVRDTAHRLELKPVKDLSPKARGVMQRHREDGWVPLMCWDDDTIGDPTARPQGRRRVRKRT